MRAEIGDRERRIESAGERGEDTRRGRSVCKWAKGGKSGHATLGKHGLRKGKRKEQETALWSEKRGLASLIATSLQGYASSLASALSDGPQPHR